MRYKYQIFVKFKIKKELELLVKKYEEMKKFYNSQNK